MATRATYLLSTGWDHQMICYYVHYDGYPEGAAAKFLQMHYCKNHRSSYAGRFFRANDDAEFTTRHEGHGDTEYRYEIDKNGTLTAWNIESFTSNKWKQIYQGTWYEFINRYIENNPPLYAFNRFEYSNDEIIMTLIEAQTLVREELIYAKQAISKGQLGQASVLEREANYIQDQIDSIEMIHKKLEKQGE